MRFGKPAGLVLAALLLSGVQMERGGVLTQAVAWVQSIWEAVAADTGPALPGPETQPTAGPDEGAHIDPDG